MSPTETLYPLPALPDVKGIKVKSLAYEVRDKGSGLQGVIFDGEIKMVLTMAKLNERGATLLERTMRATRTRYSKLRRDSKELIIIIENTRRTAPPEEVITQLLNTLFGAIVQAQAAAEAMQMDDQPTDTRKATASSSPGRRPRVVRRGRRGRQPMYRR